MARLDDKNHSSDLLKNVSFTVFAMGDSSYAHFNKAGKDLDERLNNLGAKRVFD